jgi:hypothetical protein
MVLLFPMSALVDFSAQHPHLCRPNVPLVDSVLKDRLLLLCALLVRIQRQRNRFPLPPVPPAQPVRLEALSLPPVPLLRIVYAWRAQTSPSAHRSLQPALRVRGSVIVAIMAISAPHVPLVSGVNLESPIAARRIALRLRSRIHRMHVCASLDTRHRGPAQEPAHVPCAKRDQCVLELV